MFLRLPSVLCNALCAACRVVLLVLTRSAHHRALLRDHREVLRDLVEARSGQRPAGPIRLLTNLRYFGYCFNPISVFWCHGPDGGRRAVVVEVHNTYGGRHCYLLRTDERGRAVAKFSREPFGQSPPGPILARARRRQHLGGRLRGRCRVEA